MSEITLLDGAIGTNLWNKAEKAGVEKDPVWKYNIEHPEFVSELAKEYIDVGSKILLCNTFGANPPAVKRSSDYSCSQVVSAGVKIIKEATDGTDVKTALSVGPLSMLLEPYGDLTALQAEEYFREMLDAGVGAGADMVMLQTFMDVDMMKIAAKAAKEYGVPVFCTMTFEKMGRTMMGNSVEDVIEILSPLGIDGIGMNCSLGPAAALGVIKEFAEKTDMPLVYKPNAGKPITGSDGTVTSDYTAELFAKEIEPALEFVSYVGGCCGSTPDYIREVKKLIG